MPPAVQRVPYAAAPAELRRAFALLTARAYGSADPAAELDAPLHDPALRAQSFYIWEDGRVVSYAGVVTKTLQHAGQPYVMAGLSSVATDPDAQRQGLGRQVVAAATHYIERSGVDLGVFSCAPELAPFYAAAGWPVAPRVTLLGSRAPGALSSATLGVVVLLRLFSERARAATPPLETATLDLDLPLGQFL